MQAKFTVTGGKANKTELAVHLPVVVGRSRTAGLTIAHPMVSRQHCEIREADGLLRIRDLGSTNGTYVGGNKVEEAVLRPHDQFTIGPLTFEVDYHYEGDSTVVEEGHPHQPRAEKAAFPAATGSAAGDSEYVGPSAGPLVPAESPDYDSAIMRTLQPAGSGAGVRAEDFSGVAPADGRVPDLSAWPTVPPGDAVAGSAEESAAPSAAPPSPADAECLAEHAPIWAAASGDSGAEGQERSVLDSDSNRWNDSVGEAATATSLPATPTEKPKPKKRWWPFGRKKGDG